MALRTTIETGHANCPDLETLWLESGDGASMHPEVTETVATYPEGWETGLSELSVSSDTSAHTDKKERPKDPGDFVGSVKALSYSPKLHVEYGAWLIDRIKYERSRRTENEKRVARSRGALVLIGEFPTPTTEHPFERNRKRDKLMDEFWAGQ